MKEKNFKKPKQQQKQPSRQTKTPGPELNDLCPKSDGNMFLNKNLDAVSCLRLHNL